MSITRPDLAVRPGAHAAHAPVAAPPSALPPHDAAALAFVQSVDGDAAWSSRRIRGFLLTWKRHEDPQH